MLRQSLPNHALKAENTLIRLIGGPVEQANKPCSQQHKRAWKRARQLNDEVYMKRMQKICKR